MDSSPLFSVEILVSGNFPLGKKLDLELTPDQKNDIKKRSKELGIEKIINSETGKIYEGKRLNSVHEIDKAMIKKASKLGTPLYVTKDDVKNAIDFLELFAIHINNLVESRKMFGEKYIDDKCHKALVRLEILRNQLPLSGSALKPTVKLLKGNLAKLVEATPISEKDNLSESVEMAQKILKRYVD